MIFFVENNTGTKGSERFFKWSKTPWSASYAENLGLKRKLRRRFNVIVAWGRKLSHSLDGYWGYVCLSVGPVSIAP